MKRTLTLLLCLTLLLALTLPAFAADCPALTGTAEPEWILKYGNIFFSVTIEALLAAGYEYGDIVTRNAFRSFRMLPGVIRGRQGFVPVSVAHQG